MNKQSKKPSFLETHSHIAKQWHPTKNGDLNPGKVVANINLNVWWLCPVSNDHEWKNTIAYRAKANSTCPFCLNYRLSKTNNLLALHPVLSERWHYKKNYPLTAKDVVGTGSKKVYWWRCNIDHEWKASIISHIRKDGSYRSCPKCHKAPLSVTHPNILTEWHPTKNGKLTPDDVRGGSACYLWWKCSKGPDHEWKQKAIERTRSGSGCPFCDGKKVSLTNSLLTKYPDLAKEWHPTKNGKLLTQNVFGGGKAKYWWKCSKGTDHEWQANIQKRASGQGCPICRGLKIVLSNSLFLTHPNIVKEWHVTKNSITPNDVMAGSGKKVWWQCVKVKSHEWETTIKIRAKGGHGCPFCNSGWTIEKIRLFIVSLLPYLHTLDEAELYVLIQQNGLLDISRSSKSKSFIEALKTGKFPQEELEKFVKSELSLVDAFIDDSSMTLNEYQQNLMASENVINEDDIQEAKMFSDAETKDILSSLDSPIYANLDKEAAEFFVNSAVAKIWRHAFRDEQRDEDVVEYQLAAYTGDGLYANEVKKIFLQSYHAAKSLIIPSGYKFPNPPNLMQMYVAYLIQQRKRVGNWSGTGAGKTLSAVLASRVVDAHITIICCPNNVIETWQKSINEIYPDSLIYIKNFPLTVDRSKHHYIVLNYEYFQQPRAQSKLKEFLDRCLIDFIIIDEIHFSKQINDKEVSRRKRVIGSFLADAAAKNESLHVLGMSATPVINSLFEGKSLIELVTGLHHDELNTAPTVLNCISLYQKFILHGIRWVPEYKYLLQTKEQRIDSTHLLPEIKRVKGSMAGLVELEKILTRAKIPFILESLKPKTIIYTHYVDGIVSQLQETIASHGWRVGVYTGDVKNDLDDFISGDIDILIASSCISTGINGLQTVCNRLIISSLPWTHAAFKQLVGRLHRQGQSKGFVDVIVPLAFVNVSKREWSACENRWKRIQFKKSIADAAVDGVIPKGHLRTPAQAHRDMMAWLERLERGELYETERQKINASLSSDVQQAPLRKMSDLSRMNQQINKEASGDTHQRFKNNPQKWHDYHEAYREQRVSWDVIPYQEAIKWCQARAHMIVADFGCGEALLARELKNTVYSLDHVATNDTVIACDMAHAPLNDESLDVAVFSLSLMGLNYFDYLREAKRCLKLDGHLWIAEPIARFKNLTVFKEILERLGFDIRSINEKGQFLFIEALKSQRSINEVVLKGINPQEALS